MAPTVCRPGPAPHKWVIFGNPSGPGSDWVRELFALPPRDVSAWRREYLGSWDLATPDSETAGPVPVRVDESIAPRDVYMVQSGRVVGKITGLML